jgi:hypothetical protein
MNIKNRISFSIYVIYINKTEIEKCSVLLEIHGLFRIHGWAGGFPAPPLPPPHNMNIKNFYLGPFNVQVDVEFFDVESFPMLNIFSTFCPVTFSPFNPPAFSYHRSVGESLDSSIVMHFFGSAIQMSANVALIF